MWRNEQISSDVLGASAAILNAGSRVAQMAGVPGVQQAGDLLLAFIHVIQNMKGNEGKRLEISNHVQALARIVADIQEKVSKNKYMYSRTLEDRVMQLNSELVQYEQVASRLAAMKAPERLLRNEEISSALTDLANGVKMSCERTNTQALFNIELNQSRQGQVLDTIHTNILKSSKAEIDPSTLLPFANAAYNSINVDNKSEVLHGTRVAVMEQVDKWATATCQERVFWLRGAAGTGKSTIAKSVAAKFHEANLLGASFFFVQDVQDLGDTRLLITTIACHLARLDGPVGTAITAAARKQPPGLKGSWWQVNDLLREPLKDLEPRSEPIIIVIDALDEASDRDSVITNLRLLTTQLITLPVNIKLFVTSRPDPNIESVLSGASLLVLHDIEKTILDHDIKVYIEHAFRELQYSKRGFQYTSEDIQSLIDHSGGLFIYVSTVIKLLKDSVDPSKALRGLFQRKSDRMLDQLYQQVLERAFGGHDWDSDIGDNRDAWDERFRVLGTIVLTQDRHSCSTLAALLGKTTAAIRDALSHLEAVILVPQDDDLPVRILHASFADFIVDATRCTDPHLVINTTEHHSFLAEECLHHLNRLLVENPCGIADPYALNSDISDLNERMDKFLPPHLQYASRSWAYHLSLSLYSPLLKEQLRAFCTTHLLQWLEVMSLFGCVDLAIVHLDMAFNWVKAKANEALSSVSKSSLPARMEALFGPTTQQVSDEVSMLLYDAYRFTLQFANTIIASARHLYVSVLSFTPSCLLYQVYQTRIPGAAVRVHHSRDFAWRPYLRTLSGHSGPVVAIASSKDGTHIASGSVDNTLRVWDSSTGTLLAQHQMDPPPVSVAFSSDGSRVIACADMHVHVWNWSTGLSLHRPIGSSTRATAAVAASNTSSRFALYGDFGMGEIHLWDSETGLQLKIIRGHSSWVSCVAFSPDDSQIVSASWDGKMYLWDSSTGKHLMSFKLLQDIVSFSPDGRQIVSASKDRTCVWDVQTGAKLRQRKYAPELARKLSFSPDGTQLSRVCDDGVMHVFNTSSGACTFEAHGGGRLAAFERVMLLSATFSPDGSCIFSGLSDGTIRVWDLSVNSKPDTSEHKHYSAIEGIAFSPDGTRICTWAMDENHIHVWDLSTGRMLTELKGHTRPVLSAAFSPDSTLVVGGSCDASIRIWDSINGRQMKKLAIPHRRWSYQPLSVALSPDGTRAVCGLYPEHFGYTKPDSWDVLQEVQSRPHPGSTAITFSPDSSLVYSVLSSPLDMVQWDIRSGKVVSRSEVPYNQVVSPRQGTLLRMEGSWIVLCLLL